MLNFYQPNYYHFGSDAVLLANFINQRLGEIFFSKKRKVKPPFLMLDLGCGCGVIGLLVLQYIKENYPDFLEQTFLFGLDKNLEAVESANQNAISFQLDKHYKAIHLDFILEENAKKTLQKLAYAKYLELADKKTIEPNLSHSPRLFKLLMANPPWYTHGKGLESNDFSRRNALFAEKNILSFFLNFGQSFLEKNGYFYLVAKADYMAHFLKSLPCSLPCITLQNVHHQNNKNAIFFLLESKLQSKANLVIAPPIFLNQ